ncbi:MAG: arylsulfatase, partial [Steroidobacteraceae bacterium]
RAIYEDGWKAALPYPSPLASVKTEGGKPFDENAWELYNLKEDYTERVDLAKKYPEKLSKLKALFDEEARKHNLYPLITWDDVLNRRIHRAPDSKSFAEEGEKLHGQPER